MPCSLSHQAAPPVTVQGAAKCGGRRCCIVEPCVPSNTEEQWAILFPFTRCELNCGPCALPGLQLKTSTTFPLCAASFQKTTSLRHIWTPRREAFFHLPFCPQAFCKDVRTNLGSSVHRRKGRALKTAASGGCRYPDQGERRSIICHCLLYPPSLPKKVERGEGGGDKKGKRRIKSMADATSHHRGQRLWVTVRFKKRFLNKDGDWTTVELQLTCPL